MAMNKKAQEKLTDLMIKKPKKYKLLKIMVEENVTLGEAMLKAGYSENYATIPWQATRDPDFKEAAAVIMEDWYTNFKHNQILNAMELQTWKFDNKDISEETVSVIAEEVGGELLLMYRENKQNKFIVKVPKHQEQRQALDMLYKLKGDYAAEKVELSSRFADLTDEQLDELEKTEDLKISRFKEYGRDKAKRKPKSKRIGGAEKGNKTRKVKKSSK